jgi:acetyl-CoA C-acetyltransferase
VSDDDVVIVGAARTPFGTFGGRLRDVPIPHLAATAAAAAVRRATLSPEDVDEFVMGVNLPGADRSIARQAALLTGLPDNRVAITVDRACCSSLTALTVARRALLTRAADITLAGGGENLSLVPYFLPGMRFGVKLGTVTLADQLVISCPYTGVPRAVQAADEAAGYGIGRADQDAWALRSQRRYEAARKQGVFDDEIIPFVDDGGETLLTVDESPRPDATDAGLSRLPTVYGSKSVTAGNAPGLSTGAAFLVLMRASTARERNLRPLGRVLATAQVAGHPANIASIPAEGARQVLAKGDRTLADVDLIEINEAFAAVPLVTTLELAEGDAAAADKLRERTNVNGGAVACGHPTGASGARLVMTICHELRRRGGGLGLVTICGGVGEGEAVLIRVDEHKEDAS